MEPGKSVRPGGSDDPSTWGVHSCPATDAADSFLYLASPFEYEATLEAPDAFFGDTGGTKSTLLARFETHYTCP